MFLIHWFQDILAYFGFGQKHAKILFLGLDNAGKTTLLGMLKENRMVVPGPTLFPNSEELILNNVRFRTFDLGGHETARRIWRDYYAEVDGIIFLIDAADRTRFEEAAVELNHILTEHSLLRVPVAVLGNKIDIPVAASEEELRSALGLWHHLTAGKDMKRIPGVPGDYEVRPVELFMVSILKRMGYAEAFHWLGALVK
mmetsp:Transcript_25019/g.51213  ORF Transcript_25019/g.51213 Transcript_25019/m.51213 type:complete len:199 (+) Transcript_25019:67-663(+)